MRFREIYEAGLAPGEHADVDTSLATTRKDGLEAMQYKLKTLQRKVLQYGKLADPRDVEAIRQLETVLKQFEADRFGGLDDVFKKIEVECSDFVQLIKSEGKFLYRGLKDIRKKAFTIHPRADRAPLATDPYISQAVDQIFKVAGAEANRTNSLFCSSDRSQAQNYGATYFIFPKNGFKYTWTNSHDLYYDLGKGLTQWDESQWQEDAIAKYDNPQFVQELRAWVGDKLHVFDGTMIHYFLTRSIQELDPWAPVNMANLLWKMYYDKDRWSKALGKKVPDHWLLKGWYMNGTPEECAKQLGVRVNTGIHDPLEEGLEIMILGECYALSYLDYRKFVENYFLSDDDL